MKRSLIFLFIVALLSSVPLCRAQTGNIAASGYWKYNSQSFRPTNEYYAARKPMPGRVNEMRVTGGLQAGPGDAKGSIEQFFKTDNADRVVHLTTSTLTFGANANLVTLVPLQKVVFELGLVFNANDVVRAGGPRWGYGTGSIAIDNRDYIVNVGTRPGETANAKGEATIPGGGPGATMFIHVDSGLSQFGAMHTTLDIGYVWVAGTPPTPPSTANLALNRPARQSSRSQWSQPSDAQGAVDGNASGGFGFHTESEPNPWWQVDLGAVKALSEIRIFNRRDCCSERARTLQVLLSNDGVSWTRVFSNPGTVFGADGTPLRVSVKGLSARFVRLQLAETNYLHLDEVQVYGAETPGADATPTDAVRTEPPSPPSQPPSQPPVKLPAGAEGELFNSMNSGGVGNGPTAPATFTIGQPHVITSIVTYHWNNGRGTRAGTIALRDAAGRVFGPWGVAGSPGQGGVPNAFWTATPNVTLPAGTYTIIDSEPSTWSQNAQSGGRGIAAVKSYPTDSALVPTPQPTPNGTATQPKFYLVDLTPYGGKKGTATTLRDLLIDPSSWIRLKHHGEDGYSHPKMQLAISLPQVRGTTAIALAGHLDHAYLVPQGTTVVKMTVQTTQGDVVFEIQAGVHMSEWGAPQKHQIAPTGSGRLYVPIFSLPGPRTVTGLLFEDVELPKEMDQGSDAPGFCLLGITLVTP